MRRFGTTKQYIISRLVIPILLGATQKKPKKISLANLFILKV